MRTDMPAMSSELMSFRSWMASITPSTTISGSFEALIERVPRIRMVVVAPGSPVVDMKSAPAIRPCNALSTESVGRSLMSFILTVETEPVRSFLATWP